MEQCDLFFSIYLSGHITISNWKYHGHLNNHIPFPSSSWCVCRHISFCYLLYSLPFHPSPSLLLCVCVCVDMCTMEHMEVIGQLALSGFWVCLSGLLAGIVTLSQTSCQSFLFYLSKKIVSFENSVVQFGMSHKWCYCSHPSICLDRYF